MKSSIIDKLNGDTCKYLRSEKRNYQDVIECQKQQSILTIILRQFLNLDEYQDENPNIMVEEKIRTYQLTGIFDVEWKDTELSFQYSRTSHYRRESSYQSKIESPGGSIVTYNIILILEVVIGNIKGFNQLFFTQYEICKVLVRIQQQITYKYNIDTF
ncbi:Hypothetical_protein [Hexamita inflata]|uniref:Hypothetical_protein n=1 Tax=Hexamita inflata TaxID=28002 RepID=A0AA86VNN7_9EUKA|nr:Hypothetical protein HINF_LOCUS59223 [Hexamita inflata]